MKEVYEIIEHLLPAVLVGVVIIAMFLFRKIVFEFNGVKIKLKRQEKQINKQDEAIRYLVKYSLSEELVGYLDAMNNGREFIYHVNDDNGFRKQLEFLINNNYINRLQFDTYKDQQNIISDTELTDKGREYLKLRRSA